MKIWSKKGSELWIETDKLTRKLARFQESFKFMPNKKWTHLKERTEMFKVRINIKRLSKPRFLSANKFGWKNNNKKKRIKKLSFLIRKQLRRESFNIVHLPLK